MHSVSCVAKVAMCFFNPFVSSIAFVESSYRPDVVGDNGKAVGILQIHPIMVEDVNRFSPVQYNLTDRLDPWRSQEIFWRYSLHYSREETLRIFSGNSLPSDVELVSRRWNGGPRGETRQATYPYYQKVMSRFINEF